MSAYPWLVDLVLFPALLISLITDLRTNTIPPWVTRPGIALGLILAGAFFGLGESWILPGLRSSALGGGIAFGAFFLMEMTGGMGDGDTWLMGAIGTLLGFPAIVGAALAISIVGGMQGIATLIARSQPGRKLCLRIGMKDAADPEFGIYVPYGLAIALGTGAFRIWQHWAVASAPA